MMPILAEIRFDNVDHPWLWAVLIAAGVAWTFHIYRGIFQRSERRLTWGLMALRLVGMAALVLALAYPIWERDETRVDPGRLAVVVDNSVSMSLADSSGKSRYAMAKTAVSKLREAIEEETSGPRMRVELFDINGAPLGDDFPAKPSVERTDLVRGVSEATARLRSRPLAGIAVVSDGVDNTGRKEFSELSDSPAPIYTVGFQADAEASRLDLALRSVDAPERVMVNNEVKADVVVSKTAGPAVDATVVIKRGHAEFIKENISLAAGNAEQTVSLNFTPREAGRFVFTAEVSSSAGERLSTNNAEHFPLEVNAEPIRVFYLEGYLRHEYKFLKARLEDDPDVSLVSVVRRANPQGGTEGTGGNLLTADRLENFDVLILGDMEGDYLTSGEYQAIVSWVNEGKSLLVLGGYQSFGPDGFRKTPLADALPVVFAETEPMQSEDPFVLALTLQGESSPMFEISGDKARDAALWSGAPPLLGSSLVQREKPGAEVLARNPSFVIDGQPSVVVATQRYGAGRTLVITADTTWRWTRLARVIGQADTLFARFWSQTIRWLAGREKDEDRPLITVSTDRPDYEVGKPVTVRVVRQPQPGDEAGATEVSVEVTDETDKSMAVEMRSSSTEPDVFTGSFYPASGGRFEVAAALATGGKPTANQATEFLVHGSDLELADAGTNPAALRSLSSLTGGVYVDIANAGDLAAKIERIDRRTTRVNRTELAGNQGMLWALFIFFLAAVTAEWLIRRRNHLV